jgi:exodeoxyribonuclease-3
VRLATWNVNSVVARLPRLIGWLETARPDVLCLQETKIADGGFPRAEVEALGYELALHGGGRWNGVAIVSKVGLIDVERGFVGEPGFPDPEARALSATCGGLRVWSVYVPNGRTLDNDHYQYKLRWLAAIKGALTTARDSGQALAVCGDFNIAPTDADVWDPGEFIGSTHVSVAEREALAALVALGLRDVQPRAFKGLPFTYWDYRAGMFHTGKGMRIDLVLSTRRWPRRSPMRTSIAMRARAPDRRTTRPSWSTSAGRPEAPGGQLDGGFGALAPSATANASPFVLSNDGVASGLLADVTIWIELVVPPLAIFVEPLTVPRVNVTFVVRASTDCPPPTVGAS